ncbi:putative nwd2 protein [Mycena sanguinolenta]|uniref:Putative nwd2 protein n=1 Tax=Mycena sanguinolenta TaxID=230812 RepID=A0A8H6ZAY5_9AGAR|nr:putative nwd2 protein [Mycena sanguinolenta]
MNNMQEGERGTSHTFRPLPWHRSIPTGIYMLHRMVALAAMYDSAESFPQPRCHPETRTKMLDDLRKWALESHPKTSILWLYGPAGAGKSAIMQTLAGQFRDAGRLGGCFFFKRGHPTRGNGRSLFATIAYQLALNIPLLRRPISQVVEDNPSIVALSIETQMQKLVSGPCSQGGNCEPLAIIIDGLDECEGPDVQGQILHVIRNSSSKHSIPLRFMVASRPEAHIRDTFNSPFYSGHYRSVNVEQSFTDVHKYLCNEFSRIHHEHGTMAKIPLPWPTPDVLQNLVNKSSGHFIYASTIIKFIDDRNYRPTQRLAVVQNPESSGSESAFDTLDQLYMTILSSAPRQSQLIPILCIIIHFNVAVGDIDKLFELTEGETQLILRSLHSLLDVPSKGMRISSHHASFIDFLSNPDRSGNFCVNTLDRRISLARTLLQFCAGPYTGIWRLLSRLIRFIVSLPPSDTVTELFPLIESINPDYIFDPKEFQSAGPYFGSIVAWFKNMPSAPAVVIQLWEDYAFIFSLQKMYPHNLSDPSVKHTVLFSPELLQVLLSMKLLGHQLWKLPTKLDLTWTELRTTLCSLRPNIVEGEHVLPIQRPLAACPLAARDLALQLIRKMVKNYDATDGGFNPSACCDAVFRSHRFIDNLEEAYIALQLV